MLSCQAPCPRDPSQVLEFIIAKMTRANTSPLRKMEKGLLPQPPMRVGPRFQCCNELLSHRLGLWTKLAWRLAWRPLVLFSLRSYLQSRTPAKDRFNLLNVTWAFCQM